MQIASRIKKMMVIMDSMAQKELDGYVTMNEPSRIRRIARGSGTSEAEIEQLLEEYKRMAKMVEKLGKSGFLKGDPQQMMRNPAQVQS